MTGWRRLGQSVQRAEPLATMAPLATGQPTPARGYQSAAVYHVNSRVLLTRLSSLNAVHRSVPAADVHGAVRHRDRYDVVGTWDGQKVALGQASSLVPSEYAARFTMRQSAKPNVVGLDGRTILPERTAQRPDKAFLPSINRCKSRSSSSQQDNVSLSGSAAGRMSPRRKRNGPETGTTQKSSHQDHIHDQISVLGIPKTVAPHEHPDRATPGGRDQSGDAVSGSRSQRSANQANAKLLGTTTAPKLDDYLLEPTQDRPDCHLNIRSVGYISNNTRMTPRENPWVYRYKVKKNMNQINKILTGKAPPAD